MTTSGHLKVLFCGPLGPIADPNRERYKIMQELGLDVSGLDDTCYMQFSLITRVRKKLSGDRWKFPRRAVDAFNAEFLNRIAIIQPEIVWTEKALLLLPETLAEARRRVPRAVFVSNVDDNPFGLRNEERPIWRNFIRTIPLYDLHFVKRKSNTDHFKSHGAKYVSIIRLGFFSFHRPYRPTEIPDHCKHDTVFIGNMIDQRAHSIAYLMHKEHLPVDVYGRHWNRHSVYYRHRQYFHGFLNGPIYAQIISGSKISLGYVSHSNLDEYTNRSADIPACGGFLLAERTPTHQSMYQEGEEAEFFGSDDECADKIRFYLRHDEKRQKIARAGYERCIRSDYSLKRSTREAVREIFQLRGEVVGSV